MANTATNVTNAQPAVGGAVLVAPLGTAVPTSADGSLNSAFTALGYISDEGATNTITRDMTDIKAWGGDTVLALQNSKDDKFKMTFLETMNVNVLKVVHGDTKVSGALSTGISVTESSLELEAHAWVIDMILRGNALKRIVIPNGKVSGIDEIAYAGTDATGIGIEITAMPDSSGNTHYEYIKAAASQ